jgi:hypothetical protein
MVRRKKKMTNPEVPAYRSAGHDLPLKCAWCGEVRGVEGSWRTPSHWDPRESGFSHGICPRCFLRESAALKKKR